MSEQRYFRSRLDPRNVWAPVPGYDEEDYVRDTARWEEVRWAPADAIVIDRADLPEVLVHDTKPNVAVIEGQVYGLTHVEGYTDHRGAMLRRLALMEYLREHPPVDEAAVKTARIALLDVGVTGAGEVARRLVRDGYRIEATS